MDTTPLVTVRLVEAADRNAVGWLIGSEFVEEFWLPILGPSSIALLRWLHRDGGEFRRARTLPLVELAAPIGLGTSTGRHSPVFRTLDRLARFNAARWKTPADAAVPALGVSTHLYPLPRQYADRLPEAMQVEHRRVLNALAHAS